MSIDGALLGRTCIHISRQWLLQKIFRGVLLAAAAAHTRTALAGQVRGGRLDFRLDPRVLALLLVKVVKRQAWRLLPDPLVQREEHAFHPTGVVLEIEATVIVAAAAEQQVRDKQEPLEAAAAKVPYGFGLEGDERGEYHRHVSNLENDGGEEKHLQLVACRGERGRLGGRVSGGV